MMYERTDGLRVMSFFYSISVISGQWDGDNERLCAVEPSY